MWSSPRAANISQRFLKFSSDAARLGFGSHNPPTPQAQETGVSPRSVGTRRAAARESVFRNSSRDAATISAYLTPARDQPSRDLRYPAPAEVFWWMASVILPEAAGAARAAISATGVKSISLLEITDGSSLHEGSLSMRSRLRRAVFLDEGLHRLDSLHRVGRGPCSADRRGGLPPTGPD